MTPGVEGRGEEKKFPSIQSLWGDPLPPSQGDSSERRVSRETQDLYLAPAPNPRHHPFGTAIFSPEKMGRHSGRRTWQSQTRRVWED